MKEDAILKSITNEMQVGVIVLDKDALILYANPFFLDSFSLKSDIKGRSIDEILKGTGIVRAVKSFLATKGSVGTAETAAQDREILEGKRYFSLRMVPSEGGSLMLFLQDVTEEKKVEAIKKDFVANVSHELRTPLASIKGYSETLLDGGIDDKDTTLEFLRIIDKHSTRMSHLIEDLLILSRIESHQMPMVTEPLDIAELVISVAEGLKKQGDDKGIDISIDGGSDIPKVLGDKVRLEQVVVNLLDNAIKYTPAGGKVFVTVARDSAEVRVDVKDTGIGIPAMDIARIFERFYRVDKARSRELGGTGLGLAIVKHIIQGLGGRVWVDSKPAKGSVFSFTLNLAPDAT